MKKSLQEISAGLARLLDNATDAHQLLADGRPLDAEDQLVAIERELPEFAGGNAAHTARRKRIMGLIADIRAESEKEHGKLVQGAQVREEQQEAQTPEVKPEPEKAQAKTQRSALKTEGAVAGIAADPQLSAYDLTALATQHENALAALHGRDKARAEFECKLAILAAVRHAVQGDTGAFEADLKEMHRTVTNLRIHAHHAKGTPDFDTLDARYRRYNDALKDLKAGKAPLEVAA